MGHRWRALRRRILTPNTSATLLDVRGFHKKSPESQERLETVGRIFLTGYAYAVEAATVTDAGRRLAELPAAYRGFAYEGAGMGFAMRDGLPLRGSDHVDRFLLGPGDDHVYMVYVGIGWAMARLPRFRWPAAEPMDPLLRWLVLDGYGFHQAYFRTEKYVRRRYQDPAFPWPAGGPPAYANRVVDQGIGRALWFVCGTDPDLAVDTLETFDESRRPDLYAGLGLAATYAGGASEDELRTLWRRAGEHRMHVAQGSSFAAEARVRAGLVQPHNETAVRVYCGQTPEQAAATSRELRPTDTAEAGAPAYELWRQRVAGYYARHARRGAAAVAGAGKDES